MKGNASRKKSLFRRAWLWTAVLAAAAAGILYLAPGWRRKAPDVPTAEVKLGEFVDYLEFRGEVKARSSTVVTAPFNAGDLLILKVSPNGTHVKKGDVVVQFDPSTLQRTLDQSRAALKQAEAEIDRLNAQQRIRDEQGRTDVVKAQYDIQRARLDVGAQDVLTPLEIEKNKLALAKAEQRMHEVEAQQGANRVGAAADLAGSQKKREKAEADLKLAERNMAALTLFAPVDGIITLLPNFRASTGIGLNAPAFKAGDRTYAGAEIAELPDLSTIQVKVPVAEADRGRLAPEQTATLRVDAVPDTEHKGHVDEISPLAQLDYSSWPVKKNFDLTIHLENPDPRLRPGMSATARIAVERLPDSILVSAEAVFDKGGRAVSYVLAGNRFVERAIEVGRRGNGQVLVVRGLNAGERVALKDPTQTEEGK